MNWFALLVVLAAEGYSPGVDAGDAVVVMVSGPMETKAQCENGAGAAMIAHRALGGPELQMFSGCVQSDDPILQIAALRKTNLVIGGPLAE